MIDRFARVPSEQQVDRRSFSRAKPGFRVKVTCGQVSISAGVVDMSLRGAMLSCSTTLPSGSVVCLELLEADDLPPIEIRAVVMRRERYGMAVYFQFMSSQALNRLRRRLADSPHMACEMENEIRRYVAGLGAR